MPITSQALGSNHIRYWGGTAQIRLTTDAPLSYIEREASFVLTRPVHLVFGADEPFPASLDTTCREFRDRTRDYWREWVRRLNLSYDWQEAMIRAAISLKLSNFEETGGIVAALTTSIPESPGSRRNWDYRFCWLRDAYFVVKALNRIGATQTMEDFIFFIINIASGEPDSLRPVYSVVPTDPMEEWEAPHLKGYRGDGPVRIGNAAADQAQHDTYGSIILATMPMFFDRRLPTPGDATLFRLLETHGREGRAAGARARCRHLGISRTPARAHAFGRDVLGRMQPPRGDRADARLPRSRRPIGTTPPTAFTRSCSKKPGTKSRQAYHRRLRLR